MSEVRYGFIIDNRKCIGCHSCTVACKTENHVPLGVNRSWVKYVEKGRFPNARRFFQVTRCNHCDNPPCVAICPVGAMFRRRDGIVDFDSDRCVGCKACMQACPYDAIYVDPETNTAAKCNFCAHRLEAGLEPVCVVVCPEHAIIAGDLNRIESEIGQLSARENMSVRKPEQGTNPKVMYINAEECVINPTAARHEAFYMWSTRNKNIRGGEAAFLPGSPLLQKDALTAYDVSHGRPWDWQVPVYFWLKSIGSGLMLIPAIAAALGRLALTSLLNVTLSALALLFIGATLLMLVSDLSRKMRFYKVLLQPQFRSWLARGAYIIIAYGALSALFGAVNYFGFSSISDMLIWPTVIAGIFTAGYTAFLFGQCEGCDLWQTSLLPLHLVVQAALAGGVFLTLIPAGMGGSPQAQDAGFAAVCAGLAIHLLIVFGETAIPHATNNARYAARLITAGPYRWLFWICAVALGGILPAMLLPLFAGNEFLVGLSGILTLGGLLAYEWCFIMAGQSVPNS